MSFTAKNVSINAQENVQIAAKQNVDITAESDINLAAKGNLTEQADGDMSVAVKGNINAEAKTDVNLSGQNARVDAKSKMTINGTETLASGKVTTIQGAAHKVEVM